MSTQKTKVRCPECARVMVRGVREFPVTYKDTTLSAHVKGYFCEKCNEAIFDDDALKSMERVWLKLKNQD
ncbi:YgiT-type zinc finger protein [bacterium]|nr:YgiT-type zinc finger protein [bacterium]